MARGAIVTSPSPASGAEDTPGAHDIPDDRLAGRPSVVMLDVDGTLAPIVLHPTLAAVPAETRRVIAALAARPNVSVALVSGRAAHDARRLVAVENVWTIGNHGAELMDPNGEIAVDAEMVRYGPQIARVARALEALLAPLRGVFLENKGWTLSVHYRAADDAIVPRLRAAVEGEVARSGLRMTLGKKVFEVRPPVRIDKGTAVFTLARELGALGDDAALLFAGDDATDEDAFRILRSRVPRAVTVRVGGEPATAAEFTVASNEDMYALLLRIARLTGAGQ
jgi:trehalose-phosphatase